jgi:hypothetical protein
MYSPFIHSNFSGSKAAGFLDTSTRSKSETARSRPKIVVSPSGDHPRIAR